jgi:hypothetical protein
VLSVSGIIEGVSSTGRSLTDQGGDNRPEVVICPTKPNNNEELPLIPSHANLLDLPHISQC